MFEFLMLTSIALIIFSQSLPTDKQQGKSPSVKRIFQTENKPQQKNVVPKNQQYTKKQPCRNKFNRAA